MERCRLCAEVIAVDECRNISENPQMLEIIRRMLPVVVISGDALPQHICPKCENRLHEMDNFYNTSKEADRKLREICWGVTQLPEVTNPMIVFNSLLTPAYKEFVSEPLEERFIINVIEPTGTVLLSCKTCKRTYVTESAAASHECDSHTSQPKAKPKKTASKKRKRTREKSKLCCKFCPKEFDYEKELNLHRATHDSSPGCSLDNSNGTESSDCSEAENNYSCSFCHKYFTRKTKKISHEMRHLENCF